jgi:arsenite-transporting ATPase
MDEVLALRRVAKLLSGEYDLVILDTAPTGHTLRFLELPDMFSKFTRFLWTARSKTRHLQRFYKRGEKYEADLLLDELLEEGEKIKEAFTAPTTQFIPVTTLDAMALEETENFLKVLHAYKIPVEQMVINKLFSHYQAREIEKFKILSELKLVGMPFFSREIQGIDRLKKFSEILFERKKYFI